MNLGIEIYLLSHLLCLLLIKCQRKKTNKFLQQTLMQVCTQHLVLTFFIMQKDLYLKKDGFLKFYRKRSDLYSFNFMFQKVIPKDAHLRTFVHPGNCRYENQQINEIFNSRDGMKNNEIFYVNDVRFEVTIPSVSFKSALSIEHLGMRQKKIYSFEKHNFRWV